MFGLLADNRDRLPMFAIYDSPSDFPGQFVARLFWTLPECVATNFTIRAKDIEALQDIMESCGLVKLMRSEGDEPQIVESWI
jgi:hypothetical protein